ncbi:appetite-regulating hormone [Tamandua tetradactyla]|uniref:appetite-regulating hormone n=1 Tax=Tamandua tetradactyla TaxID=48850 RepID=UPI004053C226
MASFSQRSEELFYSVASIPGPKVPSPSAGLLPKQILRHMEGRRGHAAWRCSLSQVHLSSPAGNMLSPGALCSLLLLSILWADLARAGSSFLSPEHQKAQHRKESKKPLTKLQPRAMEGWLHPEDRSQAEGAEDELGTQYNAPFDVGIKMPGAQHQQHGWALEEFLQDILGEEAKGKSLPAKGQLSINGVLNGSRL